MKFFTAGIFLVSLLAGISYGHMGIADPKPRLTGPNLRSPINAAGLPLCGVAERGPTQATVRAGSSMTMKFDGSAIHGGGHCQFAISYNNKDFAVMEDVLKNCFTSSAFGSAGNYKYDIKLPAELPSGDATIAWSWVNAIGNREYYMGCVDVKVEGTGGGSFTGPQLLVVNYPALGGGKIIPEFNGNYETGLDLFKARPSITVGPSGSGSGGPAKLMPGAAGSAGVSPAATSSVNGYGASSVPSGSAPSNGSASNGYGASPASANNYSVASASYPVGVYSTNPSAYAMPGAGPMVAASNPPAKACY
ncbi:hypothetical protein H4219_003665 [Mycoemilia scoparia]|uniref:Chitin-binding type-4 domain-containing protein n=1 Tax=Mycoemilia scoparia TaxID=417184 RepID=A0A9W7ZUD9_9FUNG|nr:hypothetical protein H4219_003665 [Mycoemilia scoparia]